MALGAEARRVLRRANRRVGRRGVARPNPSLGPSDPTIGRSLQADRGGNYLWPIYVLAERARAGLVALKTTGEVREDGGLIIPPDQLKYEETFGDNSATTFTITHNLGTEDLSSILIREVSSGDVYVPDVTITDEDTVDLDFGAVTPTTDQYRIVISSVEVTP